MRHEIVLHSYRRCPFAIRVRMVLEEKGIPYEVIEENLSQPSETLQKLHPEIKVPLLIHNGVALHESCVITEYLEETFPEPALMPKIPLERAKVRLWTHFSNEIFKPDLDLYKYEFSNLPEPDQDSLKNRLNLHFRKMEAVLAKHKFLLGNEFTLADIHFFPFYRQIEKAHKDFTSHFSTPYLKNWLQTITERPSFVKVMMKRESL